MKMILAATVVLAAALAYAAETKAPAAPAPFAGREFKSVNIEVKGNKIWTPSTFIVKKGEKVRITLINTAPSGVHAFEIDGYPSTKASVDNKDGDNTKVVEFTADKAGLFRVFCPIHAGHVGGQLLVLE
ncbi:MAG: cupredoxin domain-containing protein [Elusimicrobia bacterium]|nr:cupredoxin domain-containing protein [Elusimicrobiota bacterium]